LWMDRSLPSILVFFLWKFLSCAKFGLLYMDPWIPSFLLVFSWKFL
jgi:hypothetical protein